MTNCSATTQYEVKYSTWYGKLKVLARARTLSEARRLLEHHAKHGYPRCFIQCPRSMRDVFEKKIKTIHRQRSRRQ